jgi:hypothetical protein
MSNVVIRVSDKLEELAWAATEETQTLCYRMMALRDELAEAEEDYRAAEAEARSAWARVHRQYGGREAYLEHWRSQGPCACAS